MLSQKTGVQTHARSIKGSGVILFSPDGKRLFTGGTNDDKVQVNVWDIDNDELSHSWAMEKGKDSHSSVNELATDANGRYLAAAVFRQSKAYVWDTKTGQQVAKLNHRSVYGLAMSADAKTLFTVGWDKKIKIWSVETGDLVGTVAVEDAIGDPQLAAGDARMYGVRYSPAGNRIAVAHLDGHISIWDATDPKDLKPIHHFSGPRFIFGAFDFSPDGLWIAAGRSSGSVELYDSYTGDEMLTIGEHDNYVYTVRFGADHRRLVSGGRGVSYLWALDEIDDSENHDNEDLWKVLRAGGDPANRESGSPSAYEAMLMLGSSESGCEFIMDQLMAIKAVGDPKSMRNQGPKSPVRQAMIRKAESDKAFELKSCVHRALAALRLSKIGEADEYLNQISSSHPSNHVRELAKRLK